MAVPAEWKAVAWSVASTVSIPLFIKMAMDSTEFKFLSWGVENMCVWCYYGELGNANCYDNWTVLWRWIRARGPADDFVFFVGGTTALHMGVLWAYCGILGCLDVWGPRWVRKYKVQEKHAHEALSPARFWMGVRRVLFNNVVVTVPLTCLAYGRFEGRLDAELPTLSSALLQMTCWLFVEEVLFYYSHRLLHHPKLYPHVHKVHHEWQQPVGFVALYAHPLEHAISNLLPAVAGPLLVRAHCFLFWCWISLAICSTINTHCGYHFPGFFSPRSHDYHHEKFNEVFGVMGWLDTLHGTNKTWLKSESAKRHQVYWGLTPPWLDEPKAKPK